MHKITRKDTAVELIVQLGIIVDTELGGVSAWVFMVRRGVSESTIRRVLLWPEQRRSTDHLVLEATVQYLQLRREIETLGGLRRKQIPRKL